MHNHDHVARKTEWDGLKSPDSPRAKMQARCRPLAGMLQARAAHFCAKRAKCAKLASGDRAACNAKHKLRHQLTSLHPPTPPPTTPRPNCAPARSPPNLPVQLSSRPLTSHVLCARRIEGLPRGPASPGLPRQPRRLDRPACLLPVGHPMQRPRRGDVRGVYCQV